MIEGAMPVSQTGVECRWYLIDLFTIRHMDTGEYEYFGPYDPVKDRAHPQPTDLT